MQGVDNRIRQILLPPWQVTVVDGPALLADLATLDSLADRQLAASAADERHIADLLVEQMEFANLLLLNKCDRLAPVRFPSLGPRSLQG